MLRTILQRPLIAVLCCLSASAQDLIQAAGGQLARITDGAVVWQQEAPTGHQLQRLLNGNLLLLDGQGGLVERVPTTGRQVWSYSPKNEDGAALALHAFSAHEDGRVWLAAGEQPARLLQIDRQGRTQHDVPLGSGRPTALQLLDSGRVLVSAANGSVREVDPESGEVHWSFQVPKGPAADAARLADGRTLVASGRRVFVVRPVGAGRALALPELPAGQLTSLQPLTDGSLALGLADGGAWTLACVLPGEPAARWVHRVQARSACALVLGQESEHRLRERARRLHRQVLTLDTHKDISPNLAPDELPEAPRARRNLLLANDPTLWGTSQVDFPKMHAGGLDVAFYIVYVGQGDLSPEGLARAEAVAQTKFDAILRMCRKYPDQIELARTPADVRRIATAGKLVCAIGIENGYAMGPDLANIERYHALGARYMSLTHNRHSHLGDSYTPDEPLHGGLSELGRQAVAELNRVGILVDVSHASKDTMLQATRLSKAPVIASHSGVDGVRVHGRNLDDEQLRALAENGGVIQCVAFSSYVTDTSKREQAIAAAREELGLPRRWAPGPADTSPEAQEKRRKLQLRVQEIDAQFPRSNVADFADHIDHAVAVAGIGHVAISSDFDGGGGVVGWNHAAETFHVTLELVRRGYSDGDIAKLWSGNTLRIWQQAQAVAERIQAQTR